jgi:hypothetical protein
MQIGRSLWPELCTRGSCTAPSNLGRSGSDRSSRGRMPPKPGAAIDSPGLGFVSPGF